MVQKTETLKGTISRFLFQSQENGFAIVVLNSNKQSDDVIAKGYLPDLQAGQEVSLSGNWIFHPKFGKQFEVHKYQVTLPTSLVGLKKFLGSGLIKGIGKVYADKLVSHFGDQVLNVIEEHPQRLYEVEGVGAKRVEQITASWQQQKDVSNIMVFLQDKNISSSYAIKIYKKYGQSAVAVLQENPYRLADEIWGIGFKVADQIASKLGIPFDSKKRIKSGINFAITTAIGKGHLYIELEELKASTYDLLGLNQEQHATKIKSAFHDLYNEEVIKVIKNNGEHFVTLSQYYFTEKLIAKKINLLLDTPITNDFDFEKVYGSLRNSSGPIQLNENQQKAIMSALKSKVNIITGGPGTGKTTLIRQLLAILDDHNMQYKLAAPTGRAAKRMSESTGKFAATIHRLLEFDVSTMKFSRNDENTLQTQFLILDEASMIDTFLMNSILKAMPLYAHLILIGDIDQLPSVGAGNILNDLISSNHVPYTKLTEIFRQAQDSLIVTNAHKVNRGEFPSSRSSDPNKKDFLFIKEENPETLGVHLEKIFKNVLPRHRVFPSQTVVLSPMHRGSAGTQKINFDVQKMLNSKSQGKPVSYGGYNYKPGDRVMQLKNNYDKDVFNGDIGQIRYINHEDRSMTCRYDNKDVNYDFNELDELTLAYAISIHKSQGSEYDAVIIPIFTQHFTLLQRNLVYTAITRAKKLCILIGQTKAIAMAVKNNKTLQRKTFLRELLTTELDVI